MDPVTPLAATAAPRPDAAGAAGGRSTSADFQTFLALLTAQLRHQDPLKPVESTEFVAQLAAFSGVEQQIRGNERLESILEALTAGREAGLAEWIGREVRAAAAAAFDGRPVEIRTEPVAGAELAVLVVTDAAGAVRARLTVDPRAGRLDWAGETIGGTLPPGRYRFAIEYHGGGQLLATRAGEVFAEVVEVRRGADGIRLVLADGTELPAAQVMAVR